MYLLLVNKHYYYYPLGFLEMFNVAGLSTKLILVLRTPRRHLCRVIILAARLSLSLVMNCNQQSQLDRSRPEQARVTTLKYLLTGAAPHFDCVVRSAFCKLRLGTAVNDYSWKITTEITPHCLEYIPHLL